MFIPIKEIYELTRRIKKTHDERDLVKLAKLMGIDLNFFPMGNNETSCKGFYGRWYSIKQITINSDLTEEEQIIILAHEFAHAMLNHKAVAAFHDTMLLDSSNKMEICANYFSADWLIDDDVVMELALSGKTFFEIACEMNVLPGLLAYKYNSMEVRGYNGLKSPIDVRSKYLSEYKRPLKVAEDFPVDYFDDWE